MVQSITSWNFSAPYVVFFNTIEFFQNFLTILKIPFSKKLLKCDMEFCFPNIFEIRNVSFILQNFDENIQNRKIKSKNAGEF